MPLIFNFEVALPLPLKGLYFDYLSFSFFIFYIFIESPNRLCILGLSITTVFKHAQIKFFVYGISNMRLI